MQRFISYLVLALALATAAPGAAAEADWQTEDRVVAVIDQEVVTLRELQARAAQKLASLPPSDAPALHASKRLTLLRGALNEEIDDKLLSRDIALNHERLAVSDKDVDRAIDEVAQMNHVNRDQLEAALYAQGMTWSAYRDKLRQQLERARLIQLKVQGKIQIKDVDVRRRCLQRDRLATSKTLACAAHILLPLPADASAATVQAAQTQAQALAERLRAGDDFAAAVQKYSADRSSADGSLGCFGHGEVLEAIEDAAFKLEVGEISAPQRSERGLHLVKLLERRAGPGSTCSDATTLEAIRGELYQEEMQRQMGIYADELRKKAYVRIRLDSEA